MVRKFVSFDGDVLAEEEWTVNPTAKCFYCDEFLILAQHQPCTLGFLGAHDYVTLVHPPE